jgi:1-phosphofructokinase family hexose kinase
MVLTVCINPSIDTAVYTNKFLLGQINRAESVIKVAGGKGNNAARIVKALGCEVVALNLLGGFEGQFIKHHLESLGIKCEYCKTNGDNRRCIAILDDDLTELREPGPFVTNEEYLRMLNKYKVLSSNFDVITLSGSLPPNVPSSVYQDMIELTDKHIKVVLDAKGDALKLGIKANPYMVKINEFELFEYVGKESLSIEEMISTLDDICAKGVKIAIVSLGEKGLLANYFGSIYKVDVPRIKVVSTVGAGDAVFGSLAVGIKREEDVENLLINAASIGSAAAMQAATGEFCYEDYKRIALKAILKKLR